MSSGHSDAARQAWSRPEKIEIRVPYSAIVQRPFWRLPGGARMAVWIVPNVEHYEYQPQEVRVRDPWPRMPHPDVLGYGGRDYGNRVGFWRMLEVLDRYSPRCTVSLSMSVIQMYPKIFEAMQARDWEYMSHGLYNTRYVWGYDENRERELIAQCSRIHHDHVGTPLPGWFSPAVSCTVNTPDLVAQAGIRYYCDLYHDDQPTWVGTRYGPIVSVPYSMDLNDAMIYRQPFEAEDFATMVIDHFDTLYRESESIARVMCIALHPYMMGAPHRVRHLERALGYVAGHSDVWITTGGDIADCFAAQRPAGFAEPRHG